MKAQEVVTILTEIPTGKNSELNLKTYPELNVMFEKGMYIESFMQTYISDKRFLLTFIFRYYTASMSRTN